MKIVFAITLLDVLSITTITPMLPFFSQALGADAFEVGLILAIFPLMQLFMGPIISQSSDRFGRKPVLIFSKILSFISLIVLSQAQSFLLLVVSRFIEGFASGTIPVSQALVSDVSVGKKKARSFGIVGTAFGIGLVLGPLLTALLSPYGFQFAVFVALGFTFLSLLGTAFFLPNSFPVQATDPRRKPSLPVFRSLLFWKRLNAYLTQPRFKKYIFMYSLYGLSLALFSSGFAMFCERFYKSSGGMNLKEVSLAWSYIGLVGIATQSAFIPYMLKRSKSEVALKIGFFSAVLGYFLLGQLNFILGLAISLTFISFANGLLRPFLTGMISEEGRKDEQGAVVGVIQSISSSLQMTAPAISGLIIQNLHLELWSLLAAFFVGIGFVCSMTQNRISPTSLEKNS